MNLIVLLSFFILSTVTLTSQKLKKINILKIIKDNSLGPKGVLKDNQK